jgi:hypothetical protein
MNDDKNTEDKLFTPSGDPQYLRHYTSLAVALNLLNTHKLTLAPEASWKNWDDRFDAAMMDLFAGQKAGESKGKNKTAVFVICFTCNFDTERNWRSHGTIAPDCCITFDGPALIGAAKKAGGFLCAPVEYMDSHDFRKEIKSGKIAPEKAPFIKRLPYRGETEYRIVGWGAGKTKELNAAPCVSRLTLSPKMPKAIFEPLNKWLESAYRITVSRSALFDTPLIQEKL